MIQVVSLVFFMHTGGTVEKVADEISLHGVTDLL